MKIYKMYNWTNDRRRFKSFPSLPLLPRNFNMRMRTNFSLLPVIEEEEDIIEEDKQNISKLKRKSETRYPLPNALSEYDNKYIDNNRTIQEWIDNSKPTKLPPLVNINCMLNADVKQSHHVWNTNFGKRLIREKNIVDDVVKCEKPKVLGMHPIKSVKETSKNGLNKNLGKKNLATLSQINNGTGDNKFKFKKQGNTKMRNKVLKPPKSANQNLNKTKNTLNEKKDLKKPLSVAFTLKSSNLDSLGTSLDNFCNPSDTSTFSSISENQHFLTDWVKNILDKVSSPSACDYCQETFQDTKDLIEHKKKHEKEKQVCLLCGKVFYLGSEFIQHLLSHKGVDKLTCKKCKIYFPSMKKFKQHCDDVHLSPIESFKNNLEEKKTVNQWFPKYECKRCKEEFPSEETLGVHRRGHIKMDLMGAYLISPKKFI